MSRRTASRTALGTAGLRAVHQLLDAAPPILEDPVALSLLGAGARQPIEDAVERHRGDGARRLRARIVLRSRYAEDRLEQAVSRGVARYVILGAGFDTFALRQPGWARDLRILEVDHAATQAEKRSRIEAAGLVVPPNVRFASIDFARESLEGGLAGHGIDTGEPAFFSWLGVTPYLTEAAIEATLRSVAAWPAGSEIVFTFRQPQTRESIPGEAWLERRVADLGEPFLSRFTPDAVKSMLRAAGFSRIEFLTPAAAEERYFRGRPNDLPVPRRAGIVAAMVG
ncbi:MAG TPA: class I SAM-dependent methyltransferase [Gammaproteobacteria bacterium]|nr:class I SAM-dependent methyltransferase [Gammaproteobacteria bacterium]